MDSEESAISMHHFLSPSVDVQEVLQLEDHYSKDCSADSVESTVSGNNLRKGVRGGVVSGVIDADGASAH